MLSCMLSMSCQGAARRRPLPADALSPAADHALGADFDDGDLDDMGLNVEEAMPRTEVEAEEYGKSLLPEGYTLKYGAFKSGPRSIQERLPELVGRARQKYLKGCKALPAACLLICAVPLISNSHCNALALLCDHCNYCNYSLISEF